MQFMSIECDVFCKAMPVFLSHALYTTQPHSQDVLQQLLYSVT